MKAVRLSIYLATVLFCVVIESKDLNAKTLPQNHETRVERRLRKKEERELRKELRKEKRLERKEEKMEERSSNDNRSNQLQNSRDSYLESMESDSSYSFESHLSHGMRTRNMDTIVADSLGAKTIIETNSRDSAEENTRKSVLESHSKTFWEIFSDKFVTPFMVVALLIGAVVHHRKRVLDGRYKSGYRNVALTTGEYVKVAFYAAIIAGTYSLVAIALTYWG